VYIKTAGRMTIADRILVDNGFFGIVGLGDGNRADGRRRRRRVVAVASGHRDQRAPT
jgi:hypothetical protein